MMNKVFDTYYGGKEAAGVPQSLINVIPPHEVFAEPFGGNFTLSRWINTPIKLINDKAPGTFKQYPESNKEFRFTNWDYKKFLDYYKNYKGVFLYLDPPYLMSTRSTKQNVYECEMASEVEHKDFLNTVLHYQSNYLIAISHYPNKLYNRLLELGWFKFDYESQTRAGRRQERLYCNYDPNTLTELQDYRYLGEDKTDRQRIKRKISRLAAGLKRLPILEQKAIMLKLIDSHR